MSFSKNWLELGSTKLFEEHRKYLKDRGISDEVARINNLRSLKPSETATVWPGHKCEVLLAPYGKNYGSGRAFDSDVKFLTTGGKPNRLYVPALPKRFRGLTAKQILSDPKNDEHLIEGPFKTLAAVSHGILSIGISGSWNWQKDRQPLPALRRYIWPERRSTPLFDADVSENNNVLLPFLLLGDWLSSQGARVQYLRIPPVKGCSKAGIDDYLVQYGKEKFDDLKRENWDESEELEALRISAVRTTEGGLASLFALRYLDDVRYDNDEECWYAWTGTLWMRQPKKAPDIQERVKESVAWIIEEANKVRDEKRRKSMRTWGARCDRKQVIRGAMDLASSDARLRVSMDRLDRNPLLLGTQSGIVDLRTGAVIKSARENLVTRSVAVEYDEDAASPRWERFVSEIMCDDTDMVAFIQRFVGYLLIGGNPLRHIFFLYGFGRNGKSVFIETLLKLMGDYGEPAKSELIMKHRADRDSESAQPFMLRLRGKRYITASEVGEGMQLDAAVVKTLTGGDEMTVRGLHAAPVKFTVEGKFVIRCNHRPVIDGADQAIWDRVVEIPFDMRLEEAQQNTTLHNTLAAEMPGILNWAIQGCLTYQKSGLAIPAKVRNQTRDYRNSQDSFLQWFDERAHLDPKARVSRSLLYSDYENWCGRRSVRQPTYPISQRSFAEKTEAKGCQGIKSNGRQLWRGVRLKETA